MPRDNYHKVEGVMGATIMGDGSVALILDVQGLSSIAKRSGCFTAHSRAGEKIKDLEATVSNPEAQAQSQAESHGEAAGGMGQG